jgi:hypothetical protein
MENGQTKVTDSTVFRLDHVGHEISSKQIFFGARDVETLGSYPRDLIGYR